MRPSEPIGGELLDTWMKASAEQEFEQLMTSLEVMVADQTLARRPRCIGSGRCCSFQSFGHRLYLTGLEAARVMRLTARPHGHDGDSCPFLDDRSCSIHLVRPLGCRMFFCDPGATDWQQQLHETVLGSIKRYHRDMGIPYLYADWLVLAEAYSGRAGGPG